MNKILRKYNHEQLLNQLDLLSQREKANLEECLSIINFEDIAKLYKDVYVDRKIELPQNIKDINTTIINDISEEEILKIKNIGLRGIEEGKFAAVLMAGGQGTRLEHNGPKGTFKFEGISLFEMQARQIKILSETLNVTIPWVIMTSNINHEETLQFFEVNQYFNLNKENVHFFIQPNIVALSESGELLLNEDKQLMTTPNGNGGIFEALQTSGINQLLKQMGVTHIYLNNIDNVLVKVLDPILCGYAIESDAEVTTKTIRAKENESAGRVVEVDGKKQVIEYTELPEGKENIYRNANIGIHIFKLDFIMQHASSEIPYHLAVKQLAPLDETFTVVKKPTLKFEKFYFDIFKYADTFKTVQFDRLEEFSPLKNKEGTDSIATAYEALKRMHRL
ncbi:UTP--glucose-1-phosphate uridylyltransferase [Macrococcus armenti]|uniref:UTP--glucose-1-phosphate uridylyltransferase n=1 Tax=Macrococcus armenti TaxID=2875764 RepID=UPI001CCEAD18|nr:UTP--glucose-1-phosphate uridylyltransferase [Macrococcus armenti]UBH08980.1 UTP--glucose-1-phosphate uridylyltransferase [Macrococcus armenti]